MPTRRAPCTADNASPQAFHADANAPPVITDDTVDRAVTDFFSTSTTTTTTTTDSDQPLAVAHNMAVSGHTNNWAVLVCTSRFWFNYRHIANTLSVYRTVKRLGVPDSNIILM